MKKRKYITFLLIMFIAGNLNVNASSGRLRKDSIKTCNGVTYGQHSSDNHWHVASENSDGSYSATGNPIYSNPCNHSDNSSSNNSSNNSGSDSSSNSNTSEDNNSNSSSNNNEFDSSTSTDNNPSNSNSSSNNSATNSNSNNTTNSENSNNINNNNNSNFSSNTKEDENNPIKQEEIKSNDNTLKVIVIDGKEVDVSDNINYSTTKEKVNIEVTTTDTKATYEIKNNSTLSIGENKISIEVTAEDGTAKTYNLNINREIVLSTETGINVVINGEEVKFDNYKSTVYVSSSTQTITFDYTLKDKNAKVEMNEIPKLKFGDNVIKIKVIAEDGTEQQYEITIHKYTQVEDTISNIIVFGIFGGIGYGIYYIIKKINKKKAK